MQHVESTTQQACVFWFGYQYPKLKNNLFSIPNGAALHGTPKQRSIQWKRLEREGALAGVADLFLAVPNKHHHGIFIEVKSQVGTMSKSQTAFRQSVIDQNYCHVVCRDTMQFQQIITRYLSDATI